MTELERGYTPEWEARFMRLAREISKWSKDPVRQVGAVIVDRQRRVIGLGYNGFPHGVEDTEERLENKELKRALVVHAEVNAVLNASASVAGGAMYTTSFPCGDCAKIIIQAGIYRVTAPQPNLDHGAWGEHYRRAQMMFSESAVSFGFYDL